LGDDGGGLGSYGAVGDLRWASSDGILLGAVDGGGGPWSVGGDWSGGWGVSVGLLGLGDWADCGVERDDVGGDRSNSSRAVGDSGSTRGDGINRGSVDSRDSRLVVCAGSSNKSKGRNN